MKAIFAFDFSMIKPAMCACVNGKVSFHVWTAHIDNTSKRVLESHNVVVKDRELPSIKQLELDESKLILEHVTRASNLAEMILSDILEILDKEEIDKEDAIIANEGFAFAAKGDAVLDLSGYKYILMYTLMKAGFREFRTYSPIAIKKTADCAKKGMGKDDMINALANEPSKIHKFIDAMKKHPEELKKKVSWCTCVDDLSDAYWCYKTTIRRENL